MTPTNEQSREPALIPTDSPTESEWAPLMEDNVDILDVPGDSRVNPDSWYDSYSVGDSCYCETTFDHNIGEILVNTPLGNLTVVEVCELLGAPANGSLDRPRYNDIQCGNGPPNDAGDEDTCPGRVEYGAAGCGYIGPKWNFAPILNVTESPTESPSNAPTPTITFRWPTASPTALPTGQLAEPPSTNTPMTEAPIPESTIGGRKRIPPSSNSRTERAVRMSSFLAMTSVLLLVDGI